MLPVVLLVAALVAGLARKPNKERDDFQEDDTGNVAIGNVAGPLIGIVLTIVLASAVFGLLATLTPSLITDFGSFLDAIVTVEIGDSSEANTTEKIIKVFGIIFGIMFALFILGLFGTVVGGKVLAARKGGKARRG